MNTRKWTIAGLMWIVLIIAVWLSITRRHDPALAGSWLMGIVVAIVLHWTWFILVPRWSLELAGGDRDRQSRLLRWVIDTPIPGGPKVQARYLLAANDLAAGRYSEAEAGFRSLLDEHREGMSLPPGFESLLSNHLADTLEAMGRRDEALAVRETVERMPEEDGESSVSLQTQGQWLDHQHRYAEAVTAYQRSLALCPPDQGAVRVELMMRLALSTLNAGRPADTLRWAEAAISSESGARWHAQARQLAAVACNHLGRLEDAERHARQGVELAQSPLERGEALALMAQYRMRRGDLEEAERSAREALSMLEDQKRIAWLVLAEIEWERGRVEEAMRALEHAKTIGHGLAPVAVRRLDALIDQTLAIFHADLGHRDDAHASIRRAEPQLIGDPRLGPGLDAAAAFVHARANDRARALARIGSAALGRQDVPQDISIQRSVLSLLGWAALAVDEPELGETFLRAYLDLPPTPTTCRSPGSTWAPAGVGWATRWAGANATRRRLRRSSAASGSAAPASGSPPRA